MDSNLLFRHPHPLLTTCRECGHIGLRVTVATGSQRNIDVLRCPTCDATFVWENLNLVPIA